MITFLHIVQALFAIFGTCAAGLIILIIAQSYFYPETEDDVQANRVAVKAKLEAEIEEMRDRLRAVKEATAKAAIGEPPYFGPEFDEVFGKDFESGFSKNGDLTGGFGAARATHGDEYFDKIESWYHGLR